MRAGVSVLPLVAYAVSAKVNIHRGDDILAVSVPVENVTIEETERHAVRGRISFEVASDEWVPSHPLSALNNFGQRSHLWVVVESGGEVHEVDLGWWLHDSWEKTDTGVKVTAFDLCKLLDEDDMVWPSSPPEGATIRTEIQRLAEHLPVILDGMDDQPISRSFQWGTRRLEAIEELCAARGLTYGMKPDGCLHVWPTRTAAGVVDEYYTTDDLLHDAPRKSVERRPNRWVVTAEKESGGTRWVAERTADEEPYAPESYGRVTARHEFNVATSPEAVQEAAETYMRKALASPSARSLELAYDPRIEIGDVIGVKTPTGDHIVGRVIAYAARIDASDDLMRVDIEELLW